MDGISSLPELLRLRARETPDDVLYTFLHGGASEATALTYGELERRAAAVAAQLRRAVQPRDRVVLLYPPGLDYIVGFWGALCAGVVAVPAYPPDPARLSRTLPRLESIIADCGAAALLTTGAVAQLAEALNAQSETLRRCAWIATDQDGAWAPSAGDAGPAPDRDDLAFLQYTSGSTGAPKGVVLTHGHLLGNSAVIAGAFDAGPRHKAVLWLPPYHDMGLIGGILQPLFGRFPMTLMSPLAFLERPLRWLEAISQQRATIAGGPNFAFDLCVRKSTPAQRAALDLGAWEFAFTGAEPVRAETIDRFVAAFAASGFRRRAFYPCYGLAEATLIVSGAARGEGPVVGRYRRDDLARCKATASDADEASTVALVSSGRPLPTFDVRVVDPGTGAPLPERAIGEIWVSGPSVASGYWKQPDLSETTFRARLGDGTPAPYLRTGDLGFLDGGNLYVSGRRKDMIIVRGRNYFPDDLERSAEAAHQALRPGCGAAFAVEQGSEERVVLVHEIDPRRLAAAAGPADPMEIAAAVRTALAREHEVAPLAVVLLAPGTIPKTSSGKIQRFAAREAFSAGRLEAVATWREEASPTPTEAPAPAPVEAAPAGERPEEQAFAWLRDTSSRQTGLPAARIGDDTAVSDLGLDSMGAVELRARIEDRFGVDVPLGMLMGRTTIGELAARIAAQAGTAAPPATDVPQGALPPRARLTRGQQAVWLLHALDPTSDAYNLARAFEVAGPFDAQAFARAFERLVQRHPILGARFGVDDGGPFQEIGGRPDIEMVDLGGRAAADVEAALARAALDPLRLERDGALRVRVLRVDAQRTIVVLVAHHLVLDLWSFALVLREVATLYGALLRGDGAEPPPAGADYRAVVGWQADLLAGPRGDVLHDYWRRRLAGAPPPIELPAARAPSGSGSRAGRRHDMTLGPALTGEVHRYARARGVTPFSVLLAACAVAVRRYTGEDDLVIGAPSSGRARRWQHGTVGYMSNVLPVRLELAGDPSVDALIARTAESVSGALSHADLPFADIVAAARPTRRGDRDPYVGLLFSYQDLGGLGLDGLAPLALDLPGHALALDPLRLRTAPLPAPRPTFDLTLSVAEVGGDLHAVVAFDDQAYDLDLARAFGETWAAALQQMLRAPSLPLSALDALAPSDRRALESWGPGPTASVRPPSADEAIREHAATRGSQLAVQAPDGTLTYAELDARVDRLARRLRALGVGPDVVVAVCAERQRALVVALLAVARAGGAYLPLDPTFPAARLAAILSDAGAKLVVGTRSACASLDVGARIVLWLDGAEDAAEDGAPPDGAALPEAPEDALAYLMYTSGSTGRPKGVEVTRRALRSFLASMRRVPGIGPDDRLAAVTTVSFDIAALELYLPLIAGASIILASGDVAQDGNALAALLAGERASMMQATPITWRMLLAAGWRPGGRFVALCGGEALPPDLARALLAVGCTLFNMYGPTETTVWSTLSAVTGGDQPVTIGGPIDGTDVCVLDDRLRPVPVGAVGELCIGGVGLARGYRGRGDLTAERFAPHPFRPGERIYRTGDRCRFRRDGQLDYLGRRDHQIKLHGFRIEVAEIEAALREQPDVAQAAVVLAGDGPRDQRLVGYVVAKGNELAMDDVAEGARRLLPAYMIPAQLVRVQALPTTANGKLDRGALARQALPPPAAARRPPRNDVERALCEEWSAVFGGREVAIDDDFFALGGHSLMAMEVVARIRRRLGHDLPVRAIFQSQTIAALAPQLTGPAPSAAPSALLARMTSDEAPLSFAQRWMWILAQLHDGPAYHMPAAFRIDGLLDVAALGRAVDALVARHEILSTVIEKRGDGAVQVVRREPRGPLPVVRLDGPSPEARLAAALAWASGEARRPFALDRGPLFRATVLRLEETQHVLVVVLHHIVADGESLGLLAEDLSALYARERRAAAPPLPAVPVQYRDYAAWQRSEARALSLGSQLAYWRERLAGAPPLDLPADKLRPPVPSLRGREHVQVIAPELIPQIAGLAQRYDATPFMALLSAFEVLLHRYTGQRDICVGVPVNTQSDPALQRVIGLFFNSLVIRTQVSPGVRFCELLDQVRSATLSAFENRDLSFERSSRSCAQRDTSRSPLFQVAFALDPGAPPVPALEGLAVAPLPIATETAKLDLSVTASLEADRLSLKWEYSTDLFEPDTIEAMAAQFETLLRDAARRPEAPVDELELLAPDEVRRLVVDANDTASPFPSEARIEELVQRWIRETPDAPAIISGSETLTYGELGRRAVRVARALPAPAQGRETVIAICIERSPDLIVAMLAALQAGAAYVSLDPAYPDERLSVIRADAGADVILTTTALAERVSAIKRDGEPPTTLCIDDLPAGGSRPPPAGSGRSGGSRSLAYLIYTSGTTGKPKGTGISHRNLARLLFGEECAVVGPGERLAQLATSAFDAAPFEIWGALCRGAACVVFDAETIISPQRFAAEIARQQVTAMFLTTALFNMVAHAVPDAFRGLHHLFWGGESADATAVAAVLAAGPPRRLMHAYGPTETTTFATLGRIVALDGHRVPIGGPIANTRIYVLDARMRCVPQGAAGELYIGGEALARGYWNLPALTAERFVPDPLSGDAGARLYRTGDLVRMRRDGQLEFLGRADAQIKIRGFRIEPSEVSEILATDAAVREVAVVGRHDPKIGGHLAAYLVLRDGTAALDGVVERLRARVAEFMVPSTFTVLPSLPLNSNGKVDLRALPEASPVRRRFVAPSTPTEQAAARIISEVLGVDEVGADDSFFDLGGHSLLATQVASRLTAAVGKPVSIRMVFEHASVRRLSAGIDALPAAAAVATIPRAPRRLLRADTGTKK